MAGPTEVARSNALEACTRDFSARIAWKSQEGSAARRRFDDELLELRFNRRSADKNDFTIESQQIFDLWHECGAASHAHKTATHEHDAARQQAAHAAPLHELLRAKHHLKKMTGNTPCSEMIDAIRSAQIAGVPQKDISGPQKMLEDLLRRKMLRVSVSTFSGTHVFEIMMSEGVGEFRQTVAGKLAWSTKHTKLVHLDGTELKDDSKKLHEYRIRDERCELVAVQQQKDEVEDMIEGSLQTSAQAAADIALDMVLLRLPATAALPEKVLGEWTMQLIEEAACRSLVEVSDAARLIFQVQTGELAETEARTQIRALARAAAPEVAHPLGDVDAKFTSEVKAFETDMLDRQEQMSKRAKKIRVEQEYAQQCSKDLRSWRNDPNATQARAIPLSLS